MNKTIHPRPRLSEPLIIYWIYCYRERNGRWPSESDPDVWAKDGDSFVRLDETNLCAQDAEQRPYHEAVVKIQERRYQRGEMSGLSELRPFVCHKF